ncbi:precorrin-2 dehydrogenase/sirohydrochlorin ferrochelatase family protein [Halocalculus aciditolerans]|uniref:precorrin-2 dehydrogenase n=1 Tax=Halocalculus aciditolerans TaxID=1383812 RepID=A0A830FIT6_9EURY|nr:NAD(P)-dependent oxidoreductase [Halocalculus aciditolerans]GGL51275.1 hypothetical protein GCM10009039_06930 [Halocalculus aciditolerans]
MIPLAFDFTGETVVVFGGGRVGARKARRFAAEADVYVVSPAFADEDFGESTLVEAEPTTESVFEFFDAYEPLLAVAATDDAAVNDAVVTVARERGALVNRADRAGSRDGKSVVVPATVEDDPVSVAITTGGASPALAKHLREQIEADIEGAGEMAAITGEIRADLKARGVAPDVRRDAVRAVVRSAPVWKALRAGTAKPRREAAAVVRAHLGDAE